MHRVWDDAKIENCENYNNTELTHNEYKATQAQEIVELNNQHHLEKKDKDALVEYLTEYKDLFQRTSRKPRRNADKV